MKSLRLPLLTLAVIAIAASGLNAQQSGKAYRKTAIMNGNQVRTVFGNWGVIGQPATQGRRGAWRNDNDGYLGDVSLFVGAEIKSNGKVVHSVVTCPVDRPTKNTDTDPNTGKYWTFEPVNGYANPNGQKVAISNDLASWPPSWPDKLNDASDAGWKGSWNGYFGKKISADLETYFVMDDNNDERFNFAANNTSGIAFKPDSLLPGRNGLGLEVRVRGLQWAQFLAKDNIFWLYEISNTGTTTYDRSVFGMLVGTYVGVTSTEDYREYTNDWSFYDITQNITYTGNFPSGSMANPLWVGGVGLVGYAFLESPGNPYDGIDNDGDADSSAAGLAAPRFAQADFDTVTLQPGQQIVLINDDFTRHVVTLPTNGDSLKVYTRGWSTTIFPGRTKVVEGNVVRDSVLGDIANKDAYDGIDNNFNGLIDENYFLHFHQLKKDQKGNVLIDILRPVRHINYITGAGNNPLSMIDERRDDGIDNNQNWNVTYDDVGRDGLPGTHDAGEGDGVPTSGYDALGNDTGLPGEPHIDKTDVKESDQIGLTSFYYFVPSNGIDLRDDEGLWKGLQPGLFFVPTSIVNNRPQSGEDGDFIYGSGYFPLRARSIERFSLALVYGGGLVVGPHSVNDDIADLLKNKKTVQKIYDANYQFPQPPAKPTLTAVPGDHGVTLYWDRASEDWVDPVLLSKTFEGYKLYKSTSPDFSDIHTITDANGSPQGYRPLRQWDLKDGITGVFVAPSQLLQDIAGYSYYLGGDSGIVHSYVDPDVDNGRVYYYALVSYSKGDAATGVLPAENNFPVSISQSGVITHDKNVAVITPNPKVAGYVAPANGVILSHTAGPGTGAIAYEALNAAAVTGHQYRVEFMDTKIDGIDNNGNGLIDAQDSTEWDRRTTNYSVLDLSTYTEQFSVVDTLPVHLQHPNIASGYTLTDKSGNAVPAAQYRISQSLGTISPTVSMPHGSYTIVYQYYPIFHSPNIQGSPFASETRDADNFDGVKLDFANYWAVTMDTSRSKWAAGKVGYRFGMTQLDLDIGGGQAVSGYRHPADYRIIFANAVVDTGQGDDNLFVPPIPTNFRIYNETESRYEKFIFGDLNSDGVLSPNDELIILEPNPRGTLSYSWDITFAADKPNNITFGNGDTLLLRTFKPFRQGDTFQFTTTPARVDPQIVPNDLSRVKAVPNPYVAAASFESPLPPGITSGRGERRMEFIHVPRNATVSIFTARGEHVITLAQSGNMEDGAVVWNLKSKENLDIAYGVYFYVVESDQGKKTGKLAIIK